MIGKIRKSEGKAGNNKENDETNNTVKKTEDKKANVCENPQKSFVFMFQIRIELV